MSIQKALIIVLVILSASACQSKKKQAEILELSKPSWLKERPVSSTYYYGIGVTSKVGSAVFYEEKAKERALADIAKQIHTQIKSETSFYKMEDNKGAHEYIQSRIKATSNAFLEGYEFIDKWQDDRNVYAFYQLSKQEYAIRKAARKEKAIELATLKLNQAKEQRSKNQVLLALELYAASIDAVSGYLNEEVSITNNGRKTDLFVESKNGIVEIIKLLDISTNKKEIINSDESSVPEGQAKISIHYNSLPTSDIPVVFNYTGGYIVNDKGQSNEAGQLPSPRLPYNNKTSESLTASIDYTNLSRLVSKNLFVRQLIKQQNTNTCRIAVKFK